MSKTNKIVRIAGVNLPNKRLVIGLCYIHGIGLRRAYEICAALSLDINKRVYALSDEEVDSIRKHIDAYYVVESDLRRKVSLDIKLKKDIGCYAGLRHRERLPVRGQNTHSKSKRRGVKKVAIAGKKKPNKK